MSRDRNNGGKTDLWIAQYELQTMSWGDGDGNENCLKHERLVVKWLKVAMGNRLYLSLIQLNTL